MTTLNASISTLDSFRGARRLSVLPHQLFRADFEVESVTDSLRYAFIVGWVRAIKQGKTDEIAVVLERLDLIAWMLVKVHIKNFGYKPLQIGGWAYSFQPTPCRIPENE